MKQKLDFRLLPKLLFDCQSDKFRKTEEEMETKQDQQA